MKLKMNNFYLYDPKVAKKVIKEGRKNLKKLQKWLKNLDNV